MQDMIGSGGMLRAWVTMWNMQMLWLVAAIVFSATAVWVAEMVTTGRLVYARHRAGVVELGRSTDQE